MTCAKQTVTATIITTDGRRFIGTNFARNPQPTCPRGNMPTGVGYDLCKSICQQDSHAEVNAIAEAGAATHGATLHLEGHTYACEPCKAACAAAGIVEIIIGPAPERASFNP
jgi:deoxycytidylate deaminase